MTTDSKQQVAELLNEKLTSLGNMDMEIDEKKAAMKKAADEAMAPYLKEIDTLQKSRQATVNEVMTIANENRSLLTDGNRRKTISLRAGTIAWRESTSLVFDLSDAKLLQVIRKLGGMRRFVTRPPQIQKQVIKKDESFVSRLIAKHAAHFEYDENLTVKPNAPQETIIKDDNPYKVKTPREE